jgi:aspartate 1-decarboxylase
MLRTMCRVKIHRATVNEADLNYSGSLTIPRDLMKKLDILEGEAVDVANVASGSRFTTYAIAGEKPGWFCLNGAAARMGQPGDLIIVMIFAQLDDEEARKSSMLVAHMGPKNRLDKLTRLKASLD